MPLASASHPELAFMNTWAGHQVNHTRVSTTTLQSRVELIPAQTARIRVLAYTLAIDGNYAIRLDSWTGAAATMLGSILFGVGRPATLPYNPLGWLQTTTDGDSLTVIENTDPIINNPTAAFLMRGVIVWVPIAL
jgi:hypothetical protein